MQAKRYGEIGLRLLKQRKMGRQTMISKEYIEAATSKKSTIPILPSRPRRIRISNMERKNNGFSFRGMGSQLAYCFPTKTSFSLAYPIPKERTYRFRYPKHFERLFEKISDEPLPEDPKA